MYVQLKLIYTRYFTTAALMTNIRLAGRRISRSNFCKDSKQAQVVYKLIQV